MLRRAFRAVVTLALVFGPAAACGNRADTSELQALQAQSQLEAQNKALVTKLIAGLNAHDSTVYAELYSPDYRYYFPSATHESATREQDLAASLGLWKAFPDIHWTIKDMVAEGDRVAARFTVTGTQQGEWNGAPASGRKFEAGGIFTARIENGRIVEEHEDADLLGMMQQLGMELKPAGR